MKRETLGLGMAFSLAVSMTACAGKETDNDFKVTGVIVSISDRELMLDEITLDKADGAAAQRFADGTETFYDNSGHDHSICGPYGSDALIDRAAKSGKFAIGSTVIVSGSYVRTRIDCKPSGQAARQYAELAVISVIAETPR